MALTIAIEGTGIIANCDAIADTAGGTWYESGGGTIALSEDVFLIGSASIGGKYAAKSGLQCLDKGAATYDFTPVTGSEAGQCLYMWVSMTALGTLDVLANYPLCIRLSSDDYTTADTSNYVDFLIAGSDDKNGWTGGFKCFIIDPTLTPSRYNGTIATILANVRTIGIWIDCTGSARADSIFIGGMAIGKGLRITGTSTTGWADVVAYCTDYANRGWGMFQEREGIYYSYGKTYIGDSANQSANVSFSDAGRIIQYGISEYYESGAWKSSVSSDFSGIIIEDSADYTTTFEDGILVGEDGGRSGSTIIGNSSMDVDLYLEGGYQLDSLTKLYGTSLKDITGNIVWASPSGTVAASGNRFFSGAVISCGQFDPSGVVEVKNCVFSETAHEDAAFRWDTEITQYTFADCSFIANTVGAGIEHWEGAPEGDWEYNGLRFSGNEYDILNTAGSGISVSAFNDSDPTSYEGDTVTISNDKILEINGVRTGTEPTNYVRCHIVASTGGPETLGTVLMNEEAQTSTGDGFYKATEPYNYSTDQPVIVRARYAGYLPFETTGTITNSGLTVTAVWIEDPNYT